jgi:Concanavalin A-like lectin/glucanases superfamily
MAEIYKTGNAFIAAVPGSGSVPGTAPAPAPVLAPASTAPDVAWYTFNGDLLDYSGNGEGKVGRVSSDFVRYSPYLSKQCYNLSKDYIYTTPDARGDLQTYQADRSFLTVDVLPVLTKLTFSCYINVSSCPANAGLFDYGEQFRVSLSPDKPSQYTFNGTYAVQLSGTFLDAWRNIAFTIDGDTLIPYDNGRRMASIHLTTSFSTAIKTSLATRGRIGMSFTGGEHGEGVNLTGFISDYRIYGRVLSDTEMMNLYNYTSTTPAPGVTRQYVMIAMNDPKLPDLAWYKLDGDILNYRGNNVGKKDAASSGALYSPYFFKQSLKVVQGTRNYLEVPALPETSKLTLSCWINLNSWTTGARIFDFGDQFRAHLYTGSKTVYNLFGLQISLTSGFQNKWKQISFTVDGTTLIPYENGIRRKPITIPTANRYNW